MADKPTADEAPVDPATLPPPGEEPAPAPEPEPLPTHKDDLVALAIDRGIPSYEAWDMTVPELREKLEA